MTAKITVTLGGGTAATDLEYTDSVPFFTPGEGGVGHWSFETTFANGDDGLGEFIVDNDDGSIPKSDGTRNLAAKNPVMLTEDASGTEYTLVYGRIVEKEVTRNEDYPIADASQYRVTVQAPGDLALMKLTEDWDRTAESDYDRLVALQAYILNGSSSTVTRPWNTVDITVDSAHLAPNTNTVTMPAHTYQAGTSIDDIIIDCATTAGKVWGVVPHHEDGTGSHKCLQYILETDNDTNACTVSISDDPDDIDPVADPPVIAPQWGTPRHEAGQEQVTTLVVRYGTGDNFVVVESPHISDDIDSYDQAVDVFYDDESETEAQARARGLAMLDYRRFEQVTHTVILKVRADQVHLIAPGMSIDIKSAAAMSGQYLNTSQTRRIASVQYEPLAPEVGEVDAFYQLTLELDRRLRRAPASKGTKPGVQPAACDADPSVVRSATGSSSVVAGMTVEGNANTAIIVFVAVDATATPAFTYDPDTTVTGASYGFTKYGEIANSTNRPQLEVYYLANPVKSNGTSCAINATGLGVNTNATWGAVLVQDIDPDSIIGSADSFIGVSNTGSSANVSNSVSADTNDLILSCIAFQTQQTTADAPVPGGSQTLLFAFDGSSTSAGVDIYPIGVSSRNGAGGSTTDSWTITGAQGFPPIQWDLVLNGCDAPISIGATGSVGTGTDYVPGGTTIQMPDLSGQGGTYFDATQIEFDSTGLTNTDADDVQEAIEDLDAAITSGGAPTDVNYLVGTASGDLSAEIVVGTSPGGELGGTWASPTVDTTHSGSAHHTEDHASRHANGGADEVEAEDLATAETDTSLVLAPDGTGGVEFRAETGGGGASLTVEEVDGSPTDSAVTKIVFPNGTLGITSHVATYTPAGGGGGGGLAHSFAGTNSVGASTEAVATGKVIGKKIVLASDSLITSVDLHIQGNGANVYPMLAAVWDDNSNTIGNLIAMSGTQDNTIYMNTTYRWFSRPIGVWVAAGTYWIGFGIVTAALTIHYDTGGSDRTWSAGGNWLQDGSQGTQSDTTRNYSIRASILS